MLKLIDCQLTTKNGTFIEHLYSNGDQSPLVLTIGDIAYGTDILCRVHSHCISGHYFGGTECDCVEQMDFAQRLLADAGRGIIIWLHQEGRGNGHYAKMLSSRFKQTGASQDEAYALAGYSVDAREYSEVKSILLDQKVQSIALITNNLVKISMLKDLGIVITRTIPTK